MRKSHLVIGNWKNILHPKQKVLSSWKAVHPSVSLVPCRNFQYLPQFQRAESPGLLEKETFHFSPTKFILSFIQYTEYSTNIVMADNKFAADYDKRGQASCKKCKQKIGKGVVRIAKVVANFFHDGDGEMKQYYHPSCIFETFVRARSTTKIIEDPSDVEGFQELEEDDKAAIKQLIKGILLVWNFRKENRLHMSSILQCIVICCMTTKLHIYSIFLIVLRMSD